MSFFGKMFGGKKEQAPTTGEAIQKLRETENMLIKKQEFLESKIEEELNTARKNASKNKRGMIKLNKYCRLKDLELMQMSTLEEHQPSIFSLVCGFVLR